MSCMNAVDTNVLIYACDRSDPAKQRIAKQVISDTRGGLLPWQAACEFIAASRKLVAQGFTTEHAWSRLARLTEIYRLVLPTPSVLDRARVLHAEQRWSFWDAMIVSACLDAGVTRLYSEDLPGRPAPDGIEIVNPFA